MKNPSSELLQDPLARARGNGAAHDGTDHFWIQRLLAVALVPLVLWFVTGVVSHIGAGYDDVLTWMGSLPVAVFMVLLIIISLWHASWGLQAVIEDYVRHRGWKLSLLVLVKFVCFGFALTGTVATLKIYFMS